MAQSGGVHNSNCYNSFFFHPYKIMISCNSYTFTGSYSIRTLLLYSTILTIHNLHSFSPGSGIPALIALSLNSRSRICLFCLRFSWKRAFSLELSSLRLRALTSCCLMQLHIFLDRVPLSQLSYIFHASSFRATVTTLRLMVDGHSSPF